MNAIVPRFAPQQPKGQLPLIQIVDDEKPKKKKPKVETVESLKAKVSSLQEKRRGDLKEIATMKAILGIAPPPKKKKKTPAAKAKAGSKKGKGKGKKDPVSPFIIKMTKQQYARLNGGGSDLLQIETP